MGFGGCGFCVQGVTKDGKWPEVFCLSLSCYDPLDMSHSIQVPFPDF